MRSVTSVPGSSTRLWRSGPVAWAMASSSSRREGAIVSRLACRVVPGRQSLIRSHSVCCDRASGVARSLMPPPFFATRGPLHYGYEDWHSTAIDAM